MKLRETLIQLGGLLRCCIDTIDNLDPDADYVDGQVIDCKHEAPGNGNIILCGISWRWNDLEMPAHTNLPGARPGRSVKVDDPNKEATQ